MAIIDAQVHTYERNHPGRPWATTPDWPAEVNGEQMVAAMGEVGVDGAILVSSFSMYRYDPSYAVEVYNKYPDKFRVIRPVDPEDQRPTRSRAAVRAEFGVDADTPVVGTFAHLSIKKGYRELVRAAELVLRQMPRAQFWCFGEGPLRGELERHARAAGIADRFRLLGFRRDVPDLMRAIDVMCLPSHREGFPRAAMEAAATGVPVVASDIRGCRQVVDDPATGRLFRVRDIGALVAALRSVLAPGAVAAGAARARAEALRGGGCRRDQRQHPHRRRSV